MSLSVGNSSIGIIRETQAALKKDGDMGVNVSQKELNKIVEEVKKSGISPEESNRIINDVLKKSGSTQNVNLTSEKLGNTNSFKCACSRKD